MCEWKGPAEMRGQVRSKVDVTTSFWAQHRVESLGGGLGPGGRVQWAGGAQGESVADFSLQDFFF